MVWISNCYHNVFPVKNTEYEFRASKVKKNYVAKSRENSYIKATRGLSYVLQVDVYF